MVNEDIEIGGVTWEAVMSLTAKKANGETGSPNVLVTGRTKVSG